ncbi:hypothetical protein L3X38_006632 [Prunus dulcis]|uniref:Uncharacterized protein n=1 Tax=Prunus dulcis TaxID=3755 RepID=A0AAD4ZSY9_PRUDU|nr:hypothetical protein L3X38_006632 [Prunus dulcis]
MAKAYDRVEWCFVGDMLHTLGFAENFCHWIMECISTITYSIMINREATDNIVSLRGLVKDVELKNTKTLTWYQSQVRSIEWRSKSVQSSYIRAQSKFCEIAEIR